MRRPVITLAVATALAGVLAVELPGLRFDVSIDRLTNLRSPEWTTLLETRRIFGNDDVIAIALIGEEPVVSADRLERLRRLSRAIADAPGVARVWSLTETGHVEGVGDTIEVIDLVDELPEETAELERLRARIESSPLYRDHLLSRDGKTAAVIVFPELRPEDPLHQERVVAGVHAVLEVYNGPERIVVSGNPWVSEDIGGTMKREQGRFGVWTVVALAAALLLIFRSVVAAVVTLLACGLAAAAVMGVVAMLGRSLSVLSTAVPTVILAIGTTYAMHVLVRVRRGEGSFRERVAFAARVSAAPVIISAVTTMAGFAALGASGIGAIVEYGLLTSLGVGLAAAAVFLVLPAALVVLGRYEPERPLARVRLERLSSIVRSRPGGVVALFAIGTMVLAWGIAALRVQTTYVDFLPDDDPVNVSRKELARHLAGPNPILVAIDTGWEGGAKDPDLLRRVAALERALVEIDGIDATYSVTGLLSDMNRVAHAHEDDPEAFARIPDSRELVAQYLLLYSGSEWASDLDRLISFPRDRLLVWLRTGVYGSSELGALVDRVEELAHRHLDDVDVTVTGTLHLLFQTTDEITRGQIRSLALAGLVIGTVVMLSFRSLRLGLIAAVPNLIPLVWLFGVMGWLGIPLNVGTSVVACVCLGIATDDTVHFLHAFREARRDGRSADAAVQEAYRVVGSALVFTTAVLVMAFSVLVFSRFQPLADLGRLTALTMAGCLLADLVLLPSLLLLLGGEEETVPSAHGEPAEPGPGNPDYLIPGDRSSSLPGGG